MSVRLVQVGLNLIFTQGLFSHIFNHFVNSVTLSVTDFTPPPSKPCNWQVRLLPKNGFTNINEICLLKCHTYKVILLLTYLPTLILNLPLLYPYPSLSLRAPKCPDHLIQLPGVPFNEDLFLAEEEFLECPQTHISFLKM